MQRIASARWAALGTSIGLTLAATLWGPAGALAASPAETTSRVAELCDGQVPTVLGTTGRDRLTGTPGPDVIMGFRGKDRIRGKGGDDVICGGRSADRLYGGRGDDRVFGQKNTIRVEDESYLGDQMFDGRGNDLLDGGRDVGTDYLHLVRATGGVTLDRAAESFSGPGVGQHNTFVRIGGIIGSDYADVLTDSDDSSSISAGGGDDIVTGNGGRNLVAGGPGNDEIRGGPDDYEYLTGGDGDDTLYGDDGDDWLDGSAGVDFGDGGAGVDRCSTMEDVVSCEDDLGAPAGETNTFVELTLRSRAEDEARR